MSLNKTLKKVFFVVLITCSTFCMAQKQDLSRLITAIATVESELNEKAVSGEHVGYLQISPILVKDCNEILTKRKSKKKYNLNDRFSKAKSIEMFYIYQERYNPTFDIEKAICIWNAGAFSKKKPIKYLNKVMAEYKKLGNDI